MALKQSSGATPRNCLLKRAEKETNTTADIANSSSENTFQSSAELQETQAQKKTCVGDGSAALQAFALCLLQ